MIKITGKNGFNLDELAQLHFKRLNSKNKDGEYSSYSLIKKIKDQLTNDENLGLQLRVQFWNYLCDNDYEKLKKIITGRPLIIDKIIQEINGEFPNDLFTEYQDFTTARLNPFGKIVKNVFNYNIYRDSDYCTEYFTMMAINFCPYCNMTDIYVIRVSEEGIDKDIAYKQLDHFYPQSRFPYLALSFFNLIPTCFYCNTQCKLDKNFNTTTHFNPFDKSFNDEFKITIGDTILRKSQDLQFSFISKNNHVDKAIVDFRLSHRYNAPHIQEEIFNEYTAFKNHSKGVLNELSRLFPIIFGKGNNRINALLREHNVPLSDSEINLKRLGKLKRDLCLELNLINQE